MQKILCISLNPAIDVSCDAEQVKPTVKIRTFNQVDHPGGCGVNVARVIATLGGRPELAYLAGGATGALLSDSLDRLPIAQHRVAASAATRISYTVHERAQGLEYRFVPESAAVTSDALETVIGIVERLPFDYMVASGSLPKGAPDDIYARLARVGAEKGARIILDSSGDALREALDGGGIYLAKPNLTELEQLVGHPLDRRGAREEALRLVRSGKADNIVVSMGEAGALLASAQSVIDIAAPRPVVRSTVGAGDSFVGAMTFALASGIAVAEAFHFAVAAGSAAVMTPGTELCHRGDVLALYRQSVEDRGSAAGDRRISIITS
tara:strand:- start:10 stop:981 length:972 start_codon:yes stop_codon:yes gene_type:complete